MVLGRGAGVHQVVVARDMARLDHQELALGVGLAHALQVEVPAQAEPPPGLHGAVIAQRLEALAHRLNFFHALAHRALAGLQVGVAVGAGVFVDLQRRHLTLLVDGGHVHHAGAGLLEVIAAEGHAPGHDLAHGAPLGDAVVLERAGVGP